MGDIELQNMAVVNTQISTILREVVYENRIRDISL